MRYIFLFGILLLTTSLEAQVRFGLQGGLVVSNERTVGQSVDELTSVFNRDNLYSYGFGFVVEVPLKERLLLSPKLEFLRKGYSSRYPQVNDFKFISERLGLQLQVEYRVLPRLGLFVSPEFAMAVGQVNVQDNFRTRAGLIQVKNDFMLNGGLRYELTDELSLAARYQHSFLPYTEILYTNASGVTIDVVKQYQQAAILEVIYLFSN